MGVLTGAHLSEIRDLAPYCGVGLAAGVQQWPPHGCRRAGFRCRSGGPPSWWTKHLASVCRDMHVGGPDETTVMPFV